MPSIVTVTHVEGDTNPEQWEITSGGSVLNLTSADISVVIKPSEAYEDDDDAAHVLTEGSGVTILDATAGTIQVDLPAEVIQAPSKWLYKVIVGLSGKTGTAIWGDLWIADA